MTNDSRSLSERYPLSWWFSCARCGRLRYWPRNPGGIPVCRRCDRVLTGHLTLDWQWR